MQIKIVNLSYTYMPKTPNAVEALHNVSFEIPEGKITSIIGHTGSGKSTLIQTLNGLLIPTTGEVQVGEYKITPKKNKNKNIKKLRKSLAIVFQFPEYQLFEETVEKDVAFGLKNYGIKEKEAIEKAHLALNEVGIDESFYKRSPFELSGGEKRRVAIAGILALEPDILVLAGFGKCFGHSLGHGVGIEIHEAPGVRKADKTVLKPGMLVTIEPGVYLEGNLGVRIEDLILITEDGCEVLSPSPK